MLAHAEQFEGQEITVSGFLVIMSGCEPIDEPAIFQTALFNSDASSAEMNILVDREEYIPSGLLLVLGKNNGETMVMNAPLGFVFGSDFNFRCPAVLTATLTKRLDIDPEVKYVLTAPVSVSLKISEMRKNASDVDFVF